MIIIVIIMEMITFIMTTQIRFNVTVYEADDLFTICKAKTKISHTTWSWL